MSNLLGLLLPLGIGAALSPTPTATCLMLLSTNRKPLATAIAFLIGSSVALVAVGVFSLAFFGGGGSEVANHPSDVKNTIDVVFGSFFLILAFKLWLKVPDPNAPPPSWAAKIGSVGMGKALLFGTMMTITNFSSLPLYLSGLKDVVTANIGIAAGIVVLAVFVLFIEVALIVPIASYALAPRRAGVVLSAILRWIEKNTRLVSIFVFVVFGGLLLVKGIAGFGGNP